MNESLLSLGGLSLDRLQSFLQVAEQGSIARVAQGDPSRQSLISRQIRELETFFGVELTRRKGKGIEITEAGHDLARRARMHFLSLQDFKANQRGGTIEVRIAAGNSVLEWWLIPRMGRLGQKGKAFSFTLIDQRTDDAVAGLLDHRIDLAIVRTSAVIKPLKCRVLTPIGYSLFVPRNLVKKPDHELPLAISMGGEFARHFEQATLSNGRSPHIAYRCSSFTQAARLVQAGVSAAVLPDMALDHLGTGVQKRPLKGMGTYRRELALVWHQRMLEIRPELGMVVTQLGGAHGVSLL